MAKEPKRIPTIEPIPDAGEVRGTTSDSEGKPPISGGESGDSEPQDRVKEPEGGTETIAGFPAVSPFGIESAGSGARRGRGRPPGAKNRTESTEVKTSKDLDTDIAGLIASTNLLLAGLLDVKEFAEIPQEKNKRFADSLKKLGAVYGKTLSPKMAAWSDVMVSASSSYGPVAYAIWMTRPKKEERIVEPRPAPVAAAPPPKPNGKVAEVPSQVWNGAPIPDGDF